MGQARPQGVQKKLACSQAAADQGSNAVVHGGESRSAGPSFSVWIVCPLANGCQGPQPPKRVKFSSFGASGSA